MRRLFSASTALSSSISLRKTALILTTLLPHAILTSALPDADPNAQPQPLPEALPESFPEAIPDALPNALAEALPEPDADPQTTYVIPFSGAIYITVPNPGTPAVPAQCPANAPQPCASIGQPNYCCPSANYCAWAGGQVGCCPQGQTCSGWAGGQASWAPTSSYWAPSTTYWYASSTACPAGGGGYGNGGAGLCESPVPAPTTYVQPTSYYAGAGGWVAPVVTTTVYAGVTSYDNGQYTQTVVGGAGGQAQGQYCSTLYAQGPGLPTTRMGQCGTILVLPANGRAATLSAGWGVLMAALGAQIVWWRLALR